MCFDRLTSKIQKKDGGLARCEKKYNRDGCSVYREAVCRPVRNRPFYAGQGVRAFGCEPNNKNHSDSLVNLYDTKNKRSGIEIEFVE